MTQSAENDAAALAAIRAMHHVEYDSDREEAWGINGKCAECRQSYPCPTVRVIPPAATCSCGHEWVLHGPEVPGCCNCDCGLLYPIPPEKDQ